MAETTQSKYRKTKKDTNQPQIEDNEVRITTAGRVKKYVDYALQLLLGETTNKSNQAQGQQNTDKTEEKKDENKKQEAEKDEKVPKKKFDSIVLKATGMAINKAVITAEVVKRRVGGLHQVTDLKTLEIEDTWEPLEEGLHVVKTTRRVASIIIKLTSDSKEIEQIKDKAGYQEPIAAESIKPGTARYSGNSGGFNKRPRRGNSNNNNYYSGGGGGGYQGGQRQRGNSGGGYRGNFQRYNRGGNYGGGGNRQGGSQGNYGGGNRQGGSQGNYDGGNQQGGQGQFQGFRGSYRGQSRRGGFRGGGRGRGGGGGQGYRGRGGGQGGQGNRRPFNQ